MRAPADPAGARPPAHVRRLAALVALLAAAAAVAGLAWDAAYAGEDAFKAGGYRGTDVLTLLMVPFLLWVSNGESRVRALLLPGAFAYFLYVYASLALGAGYGRLFLLHTAAFGASLFGLVLAARAVPAAVVAAPVWVARFLVASGAFTALIWVSDLAAGPALHGSTTLVTHALDVGVVIPCVVLAGRLVGRAHPDGLRLALPLLVLEISLLPMIALQTAFQLDAGVRFTPAEIAGPMLGFVALALLAGFALRSLLRVSRSSSAARSGSHGPAGGLQ